MQNRFGFYGVLGGITLALLISKLMGCASPASADNQTEIAPSTIVVIDEESSWTNLREDSRVVVRAAPADADDLSGADAVSAPIVALSDNDALLSAGLQVGDEILVVSDGFDSMTVTSAGSLELAYERIESTVASSDSYLDVLVRRDGRNWWITVAVMPTA